MRRVLPVLLLLAACGEIPQPFRHDGINHAVAPRVARGVVVRKLDDGPRAAALAEAIVRRLVEGEVPASIREVVPGALVIDGQARPASGGVLIDWVLASSSGQTLGGFSQTIAAATWAKASPRTMSLMADELVDKLAPLLHGETAEAVSAATVRLAPLSGLPGDGDTALAAAMGRQLLRGGLSLSDGNADFVIRGQANLLPGAPGEEVLAVSWVVVGRGGEELGRATQQGAIPKGRLAGPWGGLANDIAAGGVDGVVEIVRAARGK
jgi:hypothetical protein